MDSKCTVINEGMSTAQNYFYQWIYVNYLINQYKDISSSYEYAMSFIKKPPASINANKYDNQLAVIKAAEDLAYYEKASVAVIIPNRSTYPVPLGSDVQYIEHGQVSYLYRKYDVVIVNTEGNDNCQRSVPAIHREIAKTGCRNIILID